MASQDNPELLCTLSDESSDEIPRQVRGVVMLGNFVYVVYSGYDCYNRLGVFACEEKAGYKKVKDIEVKELGDPADMVGSSVTSQLYISDWNNVFRVDLKTEVSEKFIDFDYFGFGWLSLADDRLLLKSPYLLALYDIHSGKQIRTIPHTYELSDNDVFHVIESNRDSFIVGNLQPSGNDNNTVSEMDSEGRVIGVFSNEEQLDCMYLALDSVGRVLVADWKNDGVVLLDKQLKFERVLIDNERLDNGRPCRLNYNKNNNTLAVGLENGQVKIFKFNI